MLTRKEQLVLAFLGGSILVGSVTVALYQTPSAEIAEPEPAQVIPVEPLVEPEIAPVPEVDEIRLLSEPSADPIVVSVLGVVQRPGVFEFDERSRVQQAIDAAGGALAHADLSDINLAARLIDGTTLTIPGTPDRGRGGRGTILIRGRAQRPLNPPQYTLSGWRIGATAQAVPPGPSGRTGGLIDLNRASNAELESLPGIGPKLAAEIVRYRAQQPFASIDDLERVSGIGPKRLEAVRALVTVTRR